MFKNFDGLAVLLLAIWLLAAVMAGMAGGLWVYPLIGLAFVAGAAFITQMGWSG